MEATKQEKWDYSINSSERKKKKASIRARRRPRKALSSRLTEKPSPAKTLSMKKVLDHLEDALVSADVGIDTTVKIIRQIEERVSRDKYVNTSDLNIDISTRN